MDTPPPPANEAARNILILEREGGFLARIKAAVEGLAPKFKIVTAASIEEAQRSACQNPPELFILDLDPANHEGMEFLFDLKTTYPDARALLMTPANTEGNHSKFAHIGAIQFINKPFELDAFGDVVTGLLKPQQGEAAPQFQGTLRNLHITDLIQIKCMGGSTSVLELRSPQGARGFLHFEKGQIIHATAGELTGIPAFNEMIRWKGGMVFDALTMRDTPRTVEGNWQMLLMEAVRLADEAEEAEKAAPKAAGRIRARNSDSPANKADLPKILVVDDSGILLQFVEEILSMHFEDRQVITALTGSDGLEKAQSLKPGIVLLDYALPDIQGDEVCKRLREDPDTSKIPVVWISGRTFEADEKAAHPNLVASLNKPFLPAALISTVECILQGRPVVSAERAPASARTNGAHKPGVNGNGKDGAIAFSGETAFTALPAALMFAEGNGLTGALRIFAGETPLEILFSKGQIILATSKDVRAYIHGSTATLETVQDAAAIIGAKNRQSATACPLFLTLAAIGLIAMHEAIPLARDHGKRLFHRLSEQDHMRIEFEKMETLPEFALACPPSSVDDWLWI